jgi:HK97 family phage major capsid protein
MSNLDNNTQEHLNKLADLIDDKIEKAGKASKDNLEGKVDEVVKGEVKNLVEKFNEGNEALNKRLDAIEVENKKHNFSNNNVSFKDELIEKISKSESLKAMQEGRMNNAGFDIKADVLISADFSGATSERDATGVMRVADIKKNPSQVTNMREIIPVGSTDSNVVRYVKESAYTDNSGEIAEGSAPTDSEFELTAVDAVTQKVTAVMTISQEMMMDTPGLASYLNSRVPNKVLDAENDGVLNGNGTSPNLLGIFDGTSGGTDFDVSASGAFYQSIDNAQELDVIYVSLNQLALANYSASGIVLNPTDFHKIALLKDTTNEYLRGNSIVGADGLLRINGVPVFLNNKVTAGKFIVGDFNQGSQIWQREGLRLDFGYEDGDNFSKYLVSVRAIERIAHSIYLPDAFVQGTFSTAKTAIETP